MTQALDSFTPSKYTVLVVDDDDTLKTVRKVWFFSVM